MSLGYLGSPQVYIIKSGWKIAKLLNAAMLLSSTANQGLAARIAQGTVTNSTEVLKFVRPCCSFCCTLSASIDTAVNSTGSKEADANLSLL